METLALNIRAEVRQRRYTSKWTCMHWGKVVGEVEIWWAHTAGDGGWACNEWKKDECHGECSAV